MRRILGFFMLIGSLPMTLFFIHLADEQATGLFCMVAIILGGFMATTGGYFAFSPSRKKYKMSSMAHTPKRRIK